MMNQLAHIFKDGLPFSLGRFVCTRSLRLGTRWFFRRHLVYLIEPIGLYRIDDAPFAAPPSHFDAHQARHAPRRKHPHRVVTGMVTPPADHLLAPRRHRPSVMAA